MKKIMIAGTSSGSGKTTIVCALLQYFVDRGYKAASFKCGPDYIDTMFHKEVIGAPSYNLDSYFMDEGTLKYLFKKNAADISIIEGVMGFYDGINFTESASSHEISEITQTPVILVINAKGMGNSVGAVIKGFLRYRKNNIKGVIFNCVTASIYERLKAVCEAEGVRPLGYFPFSVEAQLENRYLGLVTAAEIQDLKDKLNILAETAEHTLDIEGILDVAADFNKKEYIEKEVKPRVKIAVARDRAFCFYYEDNLNLLRELGAEIVSFSPLDDAELPENIDGLILGGGYPELYAELLAENISMKDSVGAAIENKIPCIAECGGFMYLHEGMSDITGQRYEMVGVIKGDSFKTESLRRFGYVELEAKTDNIFCKKGRKIRAHEFHYYDSENNGDDFIAHKNEREWGCAHANENIFAGYPHIHFYANRSFAESFIEHCEKRRTECMK
ncbi:MAG: cobyrinate a,c-diamide synthase [Oscillospiraceae bacterium]|nr:cobyrinate a,c-diamide synthase [Oscillospiraceae bacterium]